MLKRMVVSFCALAMIFTVYAGSRSAQDKNVATLSSKSMTKRDSPFDYNRKWELPLAPGVVLPEKEQVAISERENNELNEELKRQVFDAISVWLEAWARKDVAAYLAAYSPDFSPGNEKTRIEWERLRKIRILNKNKIRIEAVDVVLEVGSPFAVVATFEQRYRADELSEISNKMLVFIRDSETDTNWKIVDERTSY